MKLPWLISALEADGPIISVHIDTTRTDPQSAAELETRWGMMRDALAADGAPAARLDEIEELLLTPSGIGGRQGRSIFADDQQILVDRMLPAPPLREHAVRGEHPELVPLVQLTSYAIRQLLIVVDRAGADLHLRVPENPSLFQGENPLGEQAQVDGDHDELHKASVGGGSQHGWRAKNIEARVEDSWERNADAVAATVTKVVREHDPEMIMLSGDVRASALLQDALGEEISRRIEVLSGGERGLPPEKTAVKDEVARATREFRRERQRAIVGSFHESQARDGASLAGADDIAAALERGQVDELLVVIGREPESAEELLRAALRTDAGITAVDPALDGIPEGIGALLRWKDDSTPSQRIGSMSGDTRRELAGDGHESYGEQRTGASDALEDTVDQEEEELSRA